MNVFNWDFERYAPKGVKRLSKEVKPLYKVINKYFDKLKVYFIVDLNEAAVEVYVEHFVIRDEFLIPVKQEYWVMAKYAAKQFIRMGSESIEFTKADYMSSSADGSENIDMRDKTITLMELKDGVLNVEVTIQPMYGGKIIEHTQHTDFIWANTIRNKG